MCYCISLITLDPPTLPIKTQSPDTFITVVYSVVKASSAYDEMLVPRHPQRQKTARHT